MSSSSIQLKLKEADRLSRAAEESSSLQSNHIGLSFEPPPPESACTNDSWTTAEAEQWLSQPMGDMLEEWWTWRMNSVEVWPDSLAPDLSKGSEGGSTKRFSMYRTKGMKYVLFDACHEEQEEVLVPD